VTIRQFAKFSSSPIFVLIRYVCTYLIIGVCNTLTQVQSTAEMLVHMTIYTYTVEPLLMDTPEWRTASLYWTFNQVPNLTSNTYVY